VATHAQDAVQPEFLPGVRITSIEGQRISVHSRNDSAMWVLESLYGPRVRITHCSPSGISSQRYAGNEV
jgi:hypothetical protein